MGQMGWVRRLKYRGLMIANDAILDIKGTFVFGRHCSFGKNSIVVVPSAGSLELGVGCYIGRYVELGPSGRIVIGDRTSLQDRCVILGDVVIGRSCLFSYNIYISSGRHYFDLQPWLPIKDQDAIAAADAGLASVHSRPVSIEDDCWIGINVVIMPGITIGKGSVVGANSVVTRDVAPYTVVAGTPARVIKRRLDFMPPPSLVYDNPKDWPYFYSGFEVDRESLERCSQYGGIVAESKFVICLDASAGTSIHLLVKSFAKKARVIFGTEVREVSNQFSEVVFSNKDYFDITNKFQMSADVAGAKLIIKKAWIE